MNNKRILLHVKLSKLLNNSNFFQQRNCIENMKQYRSSQKIFFRYSVYIQYQRNVTLRETVFSAYRVIGYVILSQVIKKNLSFLLTTLYDVFYLAVMAKMIRKTKHKVRSMSDWRYIVSECFIRPWNLIEWDNKKKWTYV